MRSSSANWRNTSGRPLFEKNLTTAFLYPLAGITYDMASHPDIWLFLRPDKEEQTHELIFRCEDWELFSEWIAMTRTPVEAQ